MELIIPKAPSVREIEKRAPKSLLGQSIWKALAYDLPADLKAELVDRLSSVAVIESELRATVIRGYGLWKAGLLAPQELVIEDYGVVCRKVVTDTGVGFIVDAFQNSVEMENMKFHGIGTGTTAEAQTQTALVTELTTEYNPNSTRATGTTTEAAASIYQTVGTNTIDSGTPAITEHGLFSQAATGGGVMLDRSLFSAINLVGASADGLTTDYRFTINAGG